MKFEDIINETQLVEYLDNINDRLKNRDYFYHYTKLDKFINIFETKKWFLCDANCMNDRLEYENGDIHIWKNLFFTCFMTDVQENIGMWSMYGQPWKEGVLLRIPKKNVVDWVNGVKTIHEISCEDNKPTGKKISVNSNNRLFLSSIAYSNCDNPDDDERVTWSNVINKQIKNATHIPSLTGYIKDSAWDYEREIRIKAILPEGHGFLRVAIDVPDNLFDSITLISGPMFEGKLDDRLKVEIKKRVKISKSLFTDRLKVDNPCSKCPSKKVNNNE